MIDGLEDEIGGRVRGAGWGVEGRAEQGGTADLGSQGRVA